MDQFNISDYLKSIVGTENYGFDQARLRFEFAKKKGSDQVLSVWALVLAVLYLESGELNQAQVYIKEGVRALSVHSDPGLTSIFDYLNSKLTELSTPTGFSH